MMLVMIFMLLPSAQVSAERINEVLDCQLHARAEARGPQAARCARHRRVPTTSPSAIRMLPTRTSWMTSASRAERGETRCHHRRDRQRQDPHWSSLIPRAFMTRRRARCWSTASNVKDYDFDTLYDKHRLRDAEGRSSSAGDGPRERPLRREPSARRRRKMLSASALEAVAGRQNLCSKLPGRRRTHPIAAARARTCPAGRNSGCPSPARSRRNPEILGL